MNLVLKRIGLFEKELCSLWANGYRNDGKQKFVLNHSKRFLSKVINGNFSHKDGYIIRLELSDDWNGYMAVTAESLCVMSLYKTMFRDDEKRLEIMKQLLKNRYRSWQKNPENQAHFNFMLENSSGIERNECIGGYNLTYDPNGDDGNFEWIKAIDEDGWTKYSLYWDWYRRNIFDTMEKLGDDFNLRAMYGRTLFAQQEYRRHYFDAITTGVVGLDAFSKQESDAGRKMPLIYLITTKQNAHKYEKRGFEAVKVFNYKNSFELEGRDAECMSVYKNVGSDILQEIKNRFKQI